jgi:type II secretory pathway pseudopilin PulG
MRYQSGFTLVEVMIMIVVLSALAVASVVTVSGDVDQARYQATLKQMRDIRDALYGADAGKKQRSDFGYVGDMGSIPTQTQGLSALWEMPSLAHAWEVDTSDPSDVARMGAGWNGPYLKSSSFFGADHSKDAWGNPLIYQPDSGVLISHGSNGIQDVPGTVTGTAADIRVNLPASHAKTTLYLVIQKSGAVWNGSADAELNYPLAPNGTLAKMSSSTAGANGLFTFNNVPLGKRTVKFYFPSSSAPVVNSGPYEITVDRPNALVILGSSDKPITVDP